MSRPKKALMADLDKLLNFYERQQDFVGGGREVPVLFSIRELDRFARRVAPDAQTWIYRGFTLRRQIGAKA